MSPFQEIIIPEFERHGHPLGATPPNNSHENRNNQSGRTDQSQLFYKHLHLAPKKNLNPETLEDNKYSPRIKLNASVTKFLMRGAVGSLREPLSCSSFFSLEESEIFCGLGQPVLISNATQVHRRKGVASV